ncbi:MAG: CHAT domain-containing protein [Pseudomonadota bacterium]
MKVRSRVTALGAVASVVVVAACSQTEQEIIAGDTAAPAARASAEGFRFDTLSNNELWPYCAALQSSRSFKAFDRCMTEIDRRLAVGGGVQVISDAPGPLPKDGELYFSRSWTEATVTQMRADVFYNLGRTEEAHDLALKSYQASQQDFILISEGFLTGGETDFEMRRREAEVKALGLLGIIEAEWGDKQSAISRADALAKVNTSSFSSRQIDVDNIQRAWRARILASVGEMEAAYQALRDDEGDSIGAVLAGLDNFVNEINPLVQVGWFAITGNSFSYEDIQFLSQFEPRFLGYYVTLETGRIAEAKQGYEEILADPRVKGYGSVYWQALHGRGRIALAEGDPAAAIRYFEQAIDVIEGQRRSIDTEAGRVSYVGGKQDVYRDMISTLIDSGRAGDAFAFAERGKARALVDLLATKDNFGSGAVRPREAALLKQYQAEEVRLASEARTRGTALTADRNSARRALETQAPELAALVTVPAYTAGELQALIPADTTLVEYYKEGDALFAFVVTRDSITARRMDGSRVDAAVSQFRRQLGSPTGDGYRRSGAVLFETLIEPLRDQISDSELIIVPHGSLHYMPWNALPTGSGFLIDDYEISILPSASVLAFLGRQPERNGLLALGNPQQNDPRWGLPGAEAEVKAIAAEIAAADLLIGAQATEEALRSKASRSGVIHIASHGVFDAGQPLSSALLLADSGQQDGRFTASEAYELDLPGSLVTLSASETGLGRVQSGDDVIGLTRGFLFSGADAVVASLWLVDDQSTSDLMQAFYKAWAAGRSERTALRDAQLTLRRKEMHPYFWAAFQLTGK